MDSGEVIIKSECEWCNKSWKSTHEIEGIAISIKMW